MTPLTWIASYPKSGNTWLRILLACYVSGEAVTAPRALTEIVPDMLELFRLGRMLPAERAAPLAVKTHFLPSVDAVRWYDGGRRKAVYIVRNPRDVILSSKRFLRVAEDRKEAFGLDFVANRGADVFRDHNWGTWPQNVREWTDPETVQRFLPGIEVLVVRYEDMKSDTAATLARVLRFLEFDPDPDPERVARAVADSSLAKLREDEARQGRERTEKGMPARAFFGEGRSGQSLAELGEAVEEAYLRLWQEDEEFAALARQHGYGPKE